jgi:hypothetical protein
LKNNLYVFPAEYLKNKNKTRFLIECLMKTVNKFVFDIANWLNKSTRMGGGGEGTGEQQGAPGQHSAVHRASRNLPDDFSESGTL